MKFADFSLQQIICDNKEKTPQVFIKYFFIFEMMYLHNLKKQAINNQKNTHIIAQSTRNNNSYDTSTLFQHYF